MDEHKSIYIVKTSWLESCAKNAVACETYDAAWRIANAIDSDHAGQMVDELPVVAPVKKTENREGFWAVPCDTGTPLFEPKEEVDA